MARLRNTKNGVVVYVDDDTASRLLADGWSATEAARAEGYAAMKVADLKAEVERRNEGREDECRLPVDGKKADLIAALEADDADRNQQ